MIMFIAKEKFCVAFGSMALFLLIFLSIYTWQTQISDHSMVCDIYSNYDFNTEAIKFFLDKIIVVFMESKCALLCL